MNQKTNSGENDVLIDLVGKVRKKLKLLIMVLDEELTCIKNKTTRRESTI